MVVVWAFMAHASFFREEASGASHCADRLRAWLPRSVMLLVGLLLSHAGVYTEDNVALVFSML